MKLTDTDAKAQNISSDVYIHVMISMKYMNDHWDTPPAYNLLCDIQINAASQCMYNLQIPNHSKSE